MEPLRLSDEESEQITEDILHPSKPNKELEKAYKAYIKFINNGVRGRKARRLSVKEEKRDRSPSYTLRAL